MSQLIHQIGVIFQPLLDAVGDVLAYFYSIVPNYPIDVAVLTVVIMALLTPLTVKSTKNMAAMQALGPEMKKLQQKYKGAENRALMNEEMMKLYKEHKVNPASGCLPMLLQMPAFFVLYSVIRGITNTVTHPAYTTTVGGLKVVHPAHVVAVPRYIGVHTEMYHDIVAAHGQLNSFGIDFAQKLLSHHSSIWMAAPYLLLVAGSVGLQYLQMSRLNHRNPQATQANAQAAMLQKYMPLVFGLIYLNVAAIINVYFVVSSAIRIGTQEVLFRKGVVPGPPGVAKPDQVEGDAKGRSPEQGERALPKPRPAAGAKKASGTAGAGAKKASGTAGAGAKGVAGRAPAGSGSGSKAPARPSAAGSSLAKGTNGKKGGVPANGSAPKRSSSGGSNRPNASRNGSRTNAGQGGAGRPAKEHSRSKAKRTRKAR